MEKIYKTEEVAKKAGVQEIRMLYKESCLDIEAMDRDLDIEWNRLYNDII